MNKEILIKNYIKSALFSAKIDNLKTVYSDVRDVDDYIKTMIHIMDNLKNEVIRTLFNDDVPVYMPTFKVITNIYSEYNSIMNLVHNIDHTLINEPSETLGTINVFNTFLNMYISSTIGDLAFILDGVFGKSGIDFMASVLEEIDGIKLLNPYDMYMISEEYYNSDTGEDTGRYGKPYRLIVEYIINNSDVVGYDILRNLLMYVKIYAKYSKVYNHEVIIPDVDFEDLASITTDPYSFSKLMCDVDRYFRHYAGIKEA